ncbi:MAG: hypothetical protein H6598_02930 [Flavobacteriales bacterium]|nr:hypothetical protein [Flavobacteriales bacterium]
MKKILFIILILVGWNVSAQHVIKVKKSQTITGAFSYSNEDKTSDYLLFTEDGLVYLLEKSKKKAKKALIILKECAANPDCNELRSKEYTFEKNVINFSFDNTTYVKDYDGTFEEGGSKIVFKVSETNKLMIVREYKRIE